MNILKKHISKIESAVALLLAIIIFSASSRDTVRMIFTKFSYTGESALSKTEISASGDLSDYILVQESENTRLYYNEDTAALCITDTVSNSYYYTDPSDDPAFSGYIDAELSDELIIKYRYENNIISIGSRNNRVTHTYLGESKETGGVSVEYEFPLSGGSKLPVRTRYYIENGTLFAVVEKIEIPKDCKCDIVSISLLKGLGAANLNAEDFFLLPDGSGGKLSLNPTYKETDMNVSVYGKDTSLVANSTALSILPVFAKKTGDKSVFALALSGDAQMSVSASKNGESELSYIYPMFDITAVYSNKVDGYLHYKSSENIYQGEIKVAYRFLDGVNANVDTMAQVCREELYRYGDLFYAKRLEHGTPSLTLCFDGEESDYTEVKNALDRICKAGVSKLNVIYKNSLDGIKAISRLGGKKNLNALYDFCDEMGISLHLEYDIDKHISSGKVRNIFGHLSQNHSEESFKYSIDKLYDSYNYLDSLYLEELGKQLYSNNDADELTSRQQMQGYITDYIRKLSVDRNLAIAGGNIYTVKNSVLILGIPDTCYHSAEGYSALPFVQMVLHGQLNYSLSPIKVKGDFGDKILKAMEYGTMPSFYITDNYEEEIDAIATCYLNSYKILEEILDKSLESNEEVAESLRCSTFEDGKKIYVNYGTEDITFEDKTVLSKSILLAE